MGFIYLNNKSGYSFLKSTLKISDLVNKGIQDGMPSLALTDVNNMFGVAEFVKLCNQNNIKPIIGMEVKLNDTFETPLVLLASSNKGYISLCHLTSIVSTGDFSNSISLEELEKEKEGVICILPYIRARMEEKSFEERVEFIESLKLVFTGFYLGLEYYNFEDINKVENARKLAEELMLRTVPLFEVLTEKASDTYLLDVLRSIRLQMPVDKLETIDYNNHYFVSDLKIKNVFTQKEFDSSYFLAELCDVDLSKIKGDLVKYPINKDVDDFEYLKALSEKGLYKRLNNKVTKRYIDRLNYELDVIKKMGFVNYFLVVYDYIKYAKQNDIFVGAGRGSACSSLLAYSLGITNIDPLKYDLLFERFLNPERVSMPDIDADFIDSRRDEIYKYLAEKYGYDRFARIVTFSTLKARSCIRDVSKALGCTLGEIDDLSNRLKRVKDPDASLEELVEISPAFQSAIKTNPLYEKAYTTALKIEGLPRQIGLHAAGAVINDFELDNVVPVYKNSENYLVTQYDMNYIEEFNLLKMDILSISDLRIVDECVKEVKRLYNKDIDIYNLDIEDENIYKILQNSRTFNIFQFDKPSMTRVGKVIQPKCFDDVFACLALGRPGPNKFIQNFARRKEGKEKVVYPHPLLEDILKPTYGIIVYQEQIMQILVKAASFTMGKADLVRRAISKKNAEKLKQVEDDFIQGCLKNHITLEDAKKIFSLIMSFAEYGFNKCHSVVYSMDTMQMCFFKYYYPEVFYAVSLNVYGSKEKINDCVNEMRNMGVKMRLPYINHASIDFIVKNKQVIYGLSRIKGINNNQASLIVEERSKGLFKDFADFILRMSVLGFTRDEFVALIEAGALDEFKYNRKTLLDSLDTVLLYADVVTHVDEEGKVTINKSATSSPILTEIPSNFLEDLEKEKNRLSVYVSKFPLESKRKTFEEYGFVKISDVNTKGSSYKIVALINDISEIKTKKNELMCTIDLLDESGSISGVAFPSKYFLYRSILKKGNYIQIKGFCNERDENLQLSIEQAKIYKLEEGEN